MAPQVIPLVNQAEFPPLAPQVYRVMGRRLFRVISPATVPPLAQQVHQAKGRRLFRVFPRAMAPPVVPPKHQAKGRRGFPRGNPLLPRVLRLRLAPQANRVEGRQRARREDQQPSLVMALPSIPQHHRRLSLVMHPRLAPPVIPQLLQVMIPPFFPRSPLLVPQQSIRVPCRLSHQVKRCHPALQCSRR